MKKIVATCAALAAAHTAFAGTAEVTAGDATALQREVAQLNTNMRVLIEQNAKQAATAQDSTRLCYYNGQAYSLGAQRDGYRCENSGVDVAGQRNDPLRWTPMTSGSAGIGSATFK